MDIIWWIGTSTADQLYADIFQSILCKDKCSINVSL